MTLSGDGLLGAVAGALRDVPGAVIGVLPGGRGNDFARVLGIPLDAEAACDVIADGVARPVDLGLAGEPPFIGIASLGFDSEANRIANEAPARLGQLVYVYGALRALATWKHAALHRRRRRRAARVRRLERRRRQLEGLRRRHVRRARRRARRRRARRRLSASARARRRFLRRLLPKVFKGEHVNEPSVDVLRGAEVRVDADRPFTVYADGDPIGELPMTVRALPGALQVLLPA